MAGFVRSSRHPYSSLTHHGLIKMLILRALAHRNQTWEQFTGQPQINQGPILLHGVPIEEEVEVYALLWGVQIQEEEEAPAQLGGIEEEQEGQSPSDSVGG